MSTSMYRTFIPFASMSLPRCLTYSLTVLLILNARLSAQQHSITSIRERHQNSRELIRTIEADYEVVNKLFPFQGSPYSQVRIQWWQDIDVIRCKSKSTTRALDKSEQVKSAGPIDTPTISYDDFLIRDGDFTSLQRLNASKQHTASIRPTAGKTYTLKDLWSDALFVLDKKEGATLPDLLQDPRSNVRIESVREEQLLLHKLTIERVLGSEKQNLEILVDPTHSYLVRSFVRVRSSDKDYTRREVRVSRFKEVAPGIHFPAQITSKVYVRNSSGDSPELRAVTEITFNSVTVNHSIDPNKLTLELPPQTGVVDHRDRTTYLIGAKGEEVQKTAGVPMPPKEVEKPSYAIQPSGTSWAPWIGLFVIVGGCVLYFLAQKAKES